MVYAAVLLAVFLLWMSGAAARLDSGSGWWLEAGRLSALLASVGLLAQLVSVSRCGCLSALPLESLLRFHAVNGPVSIILALCHPLFLAAGYAAQGSSPFPQAWLSLLEWPYVPLAAFGLTLLFLAGLLSVRFLRRRIPFEWWKTLKDFSFAALALTFFHQLACGADMEGVAFRWLWYALYASTFAAVLWGRVISQVLLYRRHGFRVKSVSPECQDVVSIIIEGRDMDGFRFMAGQFAFLRFLAPGFRSESHPFSLSAPFDGKSIRFTVKNSGDYTARLGGLPAGTLVLVEGPHGGFTGGLSRGNKCLLVAGGIGITPLLPIAGELVSLGKDCVLIYINRSLASTALRSEIDGLAGLKTIYIMTRDSSWNGETRHPDAAAILRLVPDAAYREAFLCGPGGMMETLPEELRKAGVKAVYSERFNL